MTGPTPQDMHAGPGEPPENLTFEMESGGGLPRTTKIGREMV